MIRHDLHQAVVIRYYAGLSRSSSWSIRRRDADHASIPLGIHGFNSILFGIPRPSVAREVNEALR